MRIIVHFPRPRSLFSSICRRFKRRPRRRLPLQPPQPPPRPPRSLSSVSIQLPDNIDQLEFTDDHITFITGNTSSDEACPICLDPLYEKSATMGRCRHSIHTECMVKWLRYDSVWNCPVCRTPLVETPSNNNCNRLDEMTNTESTSVVTDVGPAPTLSDLSTSMLCSFDALEEDLLQEFLDEIAVMSNHDPIPNIWTPANDVIHPTSQWPDEYVSDYEDWEPHYMMEWPPDMEPMLYYDVSNSYSLRDSQQ